MARVRATGPLTPRQAGRRYNELRPDQAVPRAQIPYSAAQAAPYRYVVELTYVHGPTGTTETRRAQVTSESRLTREEVASAAEDRATAGAPTSPPLQGFAQDWYVVPIDTEILYAERGRGS